MEDNIARVIFTICAVILVGIIMTVFLYNHGLNFDFREYLIHRNIRQ